MLQQLKKKLLAKQQGYTLFQLGIALTLILIICMLSLPDRLFMQHRLVRTEVEKLMLMFRYAQRTALARNEDQYVELFCRDRWYQATGHREYLPEGVLFSVMPGAYGPPSHPEKALTTPITYKDDRVIFYANGIVQAGALYLTDQKRQVMYAVSTSVSPIAHIRAYRYDSITKNWIAL